MSMLLLVPAAGMPQAEPPVSDLRQEWNAIQTTKDREVRKRWWHDLDPERLQAFIEAGVETDVTDRRGWTPLHSAARYNPDPETLSALLLAGAAVDAKDNAGDTPLHWAAAENPNVDVVKSLLEAGADVNARDRFGWLPIHTAAETNSNPHVIGALLAAGAKRNKRAYFVFFRPAFLLKHNPNMSEKDKKVAKALLTDVDVSVQR